MSLLILVQKWNVAISWNSNGVAKFIEHSLRSSIEQVMTSIEKTHIESSRVGTRYILDLQPIPESNEGG
jgi:hypothetical protein